MTREIAVPIDVQITDTALVATGEFIVNRGEYAMNYNSFLNPIGNEVRVAFRCRSGLHRLRRRRCALGRAQHETAGRVHGRRHHGRTELADGQLRIHD